MDNFSYSTARPKALVHRRSSSDSVLFLKELYSKESGFNFNNDIGQSDMNQSSHTDEAFISSFLVNTEPQKAEAGAETDMGPKKMKRILSNRASARRSKERKIKYVQKLESDAANAEAQVSRLRPEFAQLTLEKMKLETENMTLEVKVKALGEFIDAKDAEIEALLGERAALLRLAQI